MKEDFHLNSLGKNPELQSLEAIINETNDVSPIDTEKPEKVEEYNQSKDADRARDSFFEKLPISNILNYVLRNQLYKLEKDGSVEIHCKSEFKIDKDYGFKGGAARYELRKALGLDAIEPRDFDVLRFSETEPWEGVDNEIAQEFMPQDLEFGDGVEEFTEDYLETRDFTINEVYTHNGKIVASEQCIRDTLRNIVRVTEHEVNAYGSEFGNIGPKTRSKALRFHAEQQYLLGKSTIEEDQLSEIKESSINPFWIAVQLDRAFERSEGTAEKFRETLINNEIIPEDISSIFDLIDYIEDELYYDSFIFRNAPRKQYEFENSHLDDSFSDIDKIEDHFDRVYLGTKY